MRNLSVDPRQRKLMFKLDSGASPREGGTMTGTILDVINGGSIWLLVADAGGRIVNQAVEPRYMADIVADEGLGSPSDLIGRALEIAEDGMSISFPEERPR